MKAELQTVTDGYQLVLIPETPREDRVIHDLSVFVSGQPAYNFAKIRLENVGPRASFEIKK